MARPGLTQHRKFLRLGRLLGSDPLALGCLELMWEKCYQNGDPYLGDEIDIEAACRWSGEPGKLTKALLDAGGEGNAGFIEPAPSRPGFQCHDLFDHAPKYVGRRLEREVEREERGQTLSQIRADAGRKGGIASKRAANERSFAAQDTANDQQIAPTPAPAPAPLGEVSPITPLVKIHRQKKTLAPVLGDYPEELQTARGIWKELGQDLRDPEIQEKFKPEARCVACSVGTLEASWQAWQKHLGRLVKGTSLRVTDADILAAVQAWANVLRARAKNGMSLTWPMLPTMINKPDFVDAVVQSVRKREVPSAS